MLKKFYHKNKKKLLFVLIPLFFIMLIISIMGIIRLNSKKDLLPKLSGTYLNTQLKESLNKILPENSRVLTEKEESKIQETIEKIIGIKTSFLFEGHRLNHQIGLIGLEQHIKRYPGDNLYNRNFPEIGMAPYTGAWGYFAQSKHQLTDYHKKLEKYYVVAQTLYLQDWNQRYQNLKEWYKYRKVLVINPDNGFIVVADIADSGPAKSTGKQFGGSPQVMYDLGFYPVKTKGKIIMIFINDPDNKIPLGPINSIISAPEEI